MNRFLRWFAVVLVLVWAAPVLAAPTTLSAPAIVWAGQNGVSAPDSVIGYDSSSGLPCIVGSTVTCQLTVSIVGGAGGAGTTSVSSTALAASLVVCSGPCVLSDLQVNADATLAGAAWWIMVFNATSLPADGAVTPAKCYAEPAGVISDGRIFGNGGVALSTGAVIGVSTSGCFTKTTSTHAAFISGDHQ